MAENTKIEWAHHTFNPWIGCAKVSDGCKNCYAEEMMDKRYARAKWGIHGTRTKTSQANWNKPYQWNKQAEKLGIRYRVFCSSLADVFEDRPELAPWRAALFHIINDTQNLDWLLLTKRPENVNRMFAAVCSRNDWMEDVKPTIESLPNVWIGTSVENQAAANERIPHLLQIPANIRFLSIEPLLGPVDLTDIVVSMEVGEWHFDCLDFDGRTINWVIVGGESGQKARPMHPDWPLSIRDQCEAAGVPFLFKQWGEHQHGSNYLLNVKHFAVLNDGKYFELREDTPILQAANLPSVVEWNKRRPMVMAKVGKHAAGRLLDGEEYNGFPII